MMPRCCDAPDAASPPMQPRHRCSLASDAASPPMLPCPHRAHTVPTYTSYFSRPLAPPLPLLLTNTGYSRTYGRCETCNADAAAVLRATPRYGQYEVSWSNEGY